MGLPAKRRTKSSKRRRASHFALTPATLATCRSCRQPVLPHHLCMHCGTYNGRALLGKHTKAEKLLRKREKARKQREQEEQPGAQKAAP